jgi:DNA helicase HerA-like ATPase
MLAWLWDIFAKPHKEIKKHIVVDEAWLFMNYKYSAVFLSQIARRGAKYNTSLMAASQSFREFLTQEGITFLNQCDTKFFLRMQKNDALALGDLFGLSPQLIERIIAFPNGRGVLRAGNESAVIQFKGFAFEEEFLESNPEAVVSR